ncbi:MAG: hypothetical protein ACOX1R_01850 [Caldicoprobacterales bacterium]
MVLDNCSLNAYQIEEKLVVLCREFIYSLKYAYDNGFITKDEYLENISIKKKFLKRMHKIHSGSFGSCHIIKT